MESKANEESNIEIDDVIRTGEETQNKTEEDQLMDVEIEKVIKNIAANGRTNATAKVDYRRVLVPMNRMKPLKENWATIVKALVEHMKIQVKMNTKMKCIEMRTSETTTEVSAIQKSEEFLKAFMCGFDLQDSIAMLRLEDLYLETFEIKDVKSLQGDHLARCIGRICGEKGKTKNAIENSTRTRIIVQDTKINILGSNTNISLARRAICSLILGAPPGKVYASLRIIGKKVNEKY